MDNVKYKIVITDDKMYIFGAIFYKDLKVIYKLAKHFKFTHIASYSGEMFPLPDFVFTKDRSKNYEV